MLKPIKIALSAFTALFGISAGSPASEVTIPSATGEAVHASIYDFEMKDIEGNPVRLDSYRGKVLLIVNVASKCGFTPQYQGLESLFKKYKDQGLVVLGFPANNFMGQEPGTNAEIKQFCTLTYGVTFPMFAKISVKGKDIHPLYTYLTSKETNPEHAGKISWNFNKFLIDREGNIVTRFGSRTAPDDEELVQAVQAALKKPQEGK